MAPVHRPYPQMPIASLTYGIIYQIMDTEILVIAVANLHRNPDYWKDRIKKLA